MLVTVGTVEVSINLRPFTIKENGLGVSSPNAIKQMIRTSETAQGIVVQFSMHFVNHAGLPKRSNELLNYFTSQYTPNWELEPPDAAAIEKNMRDLLVRCEQSSRPFGKEQLNHTLSRFSTRLQLKARNTHHRSSGI